MNQTRKVFACLAPKSFRARIARIMGLALSLFVLSVGSVARAQTSPGDLTIYASALAPDWQNWSWATVDLSSTAVVYSDSTASISVAATPWSALSLEHAAFSTAGYGSLTFWINGGPNGQPALSVVPTLNNVNQPGVTIGPIPANTWQQVKVTLDSLGVANVADFTGFWIQEGQGTDESQNPFYVDDIVLAAAVPVVPAPPLDGGMAVYQDGFVSGWQNWSWATVDSANTSVVYTGTYSIAVTASPYSALAFNHAAFDTSLFTSLTFWINGGSTGGQVLAVVALLGGVAQPSVTIGPLTANTWQKVSISLASLGASNQPNLTDIWLQEHAGVTSPTFYVDDVRLDLAPAPSVVNVKVDAKSEIRRVDPRTFGLNTAVWDSVLDTPTTVGLLDELDNRALRFPGGSTSDTYHWKTNISDGQTTQWATSFDDFARTATATRAQVFITANYGSGTPEEAAEWVRYSNRQKRYGFEYWEIGNEVYGSWENDTNTRPNDPVTYATRFAQYARKMKAADPFVKIGAVILASEDSYANYADESVVNPRTGVSHSGWSAVMLATFQKLGVFPDFVAYHRYEQGPGGESDIYLLGAAKTWSDDATTIRQILNDYLGPRAKRVEMACTETNSVYSDPGKQSTSLVNGLFFADAIGNIMKTEFDSFLWWDLRNGQGQGNNSDLLYGWREYGDYGVVDAAQPAGPADRYPTFYVYKLLKHFARGGESVLDVTSDYAGLGVYAVREPHSGTLNLLIINKHPLVSLNASVEIKGFWAHERAEVYSYGMPQDASAQTGVGSADVAESSVELGDRTLTYAPAPYSATVIRLRPRRAEGASPEEGGSFR
jgi:hypothetical protein